MSRSAPVACSSVNALCLGLLMLAGWWAGARSGGGNAADSELSRFEDGALALFGLLLAFCFSGAAARYDTRKQLVLAEATAIGDFAGTAKRLGSAIAYTALVALVFWVTMALEHARRGLLRISQRPMLELAAHLPQP
ncbi:MAG: hypothetical protein RL701_3010 [Pseudomonadota bacterium]